MQPGTLPFSNQVSRVLTIKLDSRRSPRRGEKKPVYVLKISVPPSEVDNGLDPAKTIVGLQVRYSIQNIASCDLIRPRVRIKHQFYPF